MKHLDPLDALDRVDAQDADPGIAQPRRVFFAGRYSSERVTPMRPGSQDFLKIPSRFGDQLVYRQDSERA